MAANLKHRVGSSSSTAARLSPIDARAGSGATPQMAAGGAGEEKLGFVEKITTAWGTVIEQVNSSVSNVHALCACCVRRGRHMYAAVYLKRIGHGHQRLHATCASEEGPRARCAVT